MESNCLISIITVCYNASKTIEKTIRSVLEQDFSDYEYIVVDGASTDNTKEIFDKYKSSFRVKTIWNSEPDKGIYDAMNKGARLASGDYLLFLNADDILTKDALSIYGKSISQTSISPDIVYGNTIVKYHNNGKEESKVRIATTPITQRTLCDGMGIVHQSMIASKALFDKLGGFNIRFTVGADWDFLIRSVKADAKLLYVNESLSVFDLDGVSSRLHNLQRHQIRKENKLYQGVDWWMIKDFLRLSSIIQYVLGQNVYNKIRYYANKYRVK